MCFCTEANWCAFILKLDLGPRNVACCLISCQFTGCSFGAAAIMQYEAIKSRVQTAKDGEELEKLALVKGHTKQLKLL